MRLNVRINAVGWRVFASVEHSLPAGARPRYGEGRDNRTRDPTVGAGGWKCLASLRSRRPTALRHGEDRGLLRGFVPGARRRVGVERVGTVIEVAARDGPAGARRAAGPMGPTGSPSVNHDSTESPTVEKDPARRKGGGRAAGAACAGETRPGARARKGLERNGRADPV
jgi:hypothetical protein